MCDSPKTITWSGHSCRTEPIQRSTSHADVVSRLAHRRHLDLVPDTLALFPAGTLRSLAEQPTGRGLDRPLAGLDRGALLHLETERHIIIAPGRITGEVTR